MSRYLSGDCEHFRTVYLKRIESALTGIEKNYGEMDFENAREKDVDMRDQLDKMKNKLNAAKGELNSMTFE